MKLLVKKATTSYLIAIFIQDSSSTTGAGLTGLTSGSSGLVCYRARSDDGNAGGTQISLSGGTKGTWSSGGFVEKDATNMPGVYELGLPNTAIATGSDYCIVMLKGATNMAPLALEIQLTAFDPTDSVRLGLTALPNVASGSAGAIPTTGTGSNQISVTSGQVILQTGTGTGQLDFTSGVVKANATQWLGGTIPAVNVTGVPKVDIVDWLGTAPNSLISGHVDALNGSVRSNTAAAGAASTITLDASSSATDNFYNGLYVLILSGTGAGQARLIKSYVGSTQVATIAPNWTTNPSSSSVFSLLPAAYADVVAWLETAVTAATAGIPDVNTKNYNNTAAQTDASNLPKVDLEDIAGSAVSASTAQLGVNVVNWRGGAVPAVSVTGVPKVDVADWLGTTVTAATAGIPDTNVKNYNNLVAQTDANSLPKVDIEDIVGAAVSTSSAQLGVNLVNWKGTALTSTVPPDTVFIRSGTAQGGGASTITLDSGASATDNLYQGEIVFIRSGTGVGQSNIISSYVGSTKVATVGTAWATQPDNTSVFTVLAEGPSAASVTGTVNANVTQIAGSAVSTSTAQLGVNVVNWRSGAVPAVSVTGVPKVDVADWLGTAVTAATAGIPDANVKNYNNLTAQTDVNSLPKVDLEDIVGTAVSTSTAQLGVNVVNWRGGAVPATSVTGVPKVDVADWLGTAVTAATAGIPDANVKNFNNSTAVTLPTNFASLAIDSSGNVAITSNVKKNQALSGFTFTMTDSTTHAPKTGLTVTAKRSLNGAAFASCTNSVSELSNGDYTLDLAAADLNANVVMLLLTATGADDLNILIITQS